MLRCWEQRIFAAPVGTAKDPFRFVKVGFSIVLTQPGLSALEIQRVIQPRQTAWGAFDNYDRETKLVTRFQELGLTMSVPTKEGFCLAVLLLVMISGVIDASGLTLSVYNTADSGAGSLRQAINDNNALGGGHTIVFSNTATGTINLTSGELAITKDVAINGPGATMLSISGGTQFRALSVSNNAAVTINDLSIVSCKMSPFGPSSVISGAGIINFGSLSMNRCIVADNSVYPGNHGSGLYNSGIARLRDCLFRNNTSAFNGGAIANAGGTLTLTNCTLFMNTAVRGSGIWSSGNATVFASTVISNYNNDFFGAIYTTGNAIVGSTVIARSTGFGSDVGGAFTSLGYNLIGAANGSTGFNSTGDQAGTTNSSLNPVLGSLQNNGGPTPTLLPLAGSPVIDQGRSGAGFDARGRARPLDYAGVPNATLGDGSDIGAVELGAPLIVTTTNDSGLGSLRQAIVEASTPENTIAFAANLSGTITLTNGVLGISKTLNIVGPGAGVLAISGNSSSGVFETLGGTVAISGLTIRNGRVTGTSGGFEQNGAQGRGGGIFNQTTLTLNDCVISNCVAQGGSGGGTGSGVAGNGGSAYGGGIANIGTLRATNCSVYGNQVIGGAGGTSTSGGFDGSGGQAYGGAVYSAGTLSMARCSLALNSTSGGTGGGGNGSGSGGGLANDQDATLVISTVASNTVSGSGNGSGGGIYDNGNSLTLRCLTIASNTADYGGGIYVAGVAPNLGGCILAANRASGDGPDCSGSINSSDFNLIGTTSGMSISGTTTHNLSGNPQLGSLGFYGGIGPSFSMKLASPAVDKGNAFGNSVDQRGLPRIVLFSAISSPFDGSDIGAFELNRPPLRIAKVGANAVVSWPSYAGGFRLESTTNIAPPLTWTSPVGAPVSIGDTFYSTNSIAGIRFFHLVLP